MAQTVDQTVDQIVVATYSSGLTRDGPGVLYADMLKGDDPQIEAVVRVIASRAPDVLLLTDLDWDGQGAALAALQARLRQAGVEYPYHHAPRPNSGVASGVDLDGDGTRDGPRDAQGYGRFTGQGGMAILSRHPILPEASRDFSAFLWEALPESLIDGAALSPEARAVQRLSSVGHWDVAVMIRDRPLHLWAMSATPPVFDGPEDRNGRRNHDETAFWLRYMEGQLPQVPQDAAFVLLGDLALDPVDGEGRRAALDALLADPRLQDPRPASEGGRAHPSAGADLEHRGAPGLDTAVYDSEGPGALRVDYVLPAATLRVRDSGVVWPVAGSGDGALAEAAATASRHRMVWVAIAWP